MGSEMCIRDSASAERRLGAALGGIGSAAAAIDVARLARARERGSAGRTEGRAECTREAVQQEQGRLGWAVAARKRPPSARFGSASSAPSVVVLDPVRTAARAPAAAATTVAAAAAAAGRTVRTTAQLERRRRDAPAEQLACASARTCERRVATAGTAARRLARAAACHVSRHAGRAVRNGKGARAQHRVIQTVVRSAWLRRARALARARACVGGVRLRVRSERRSTRLAGN